MKIKEKFKISGKVKCILKNVITGEIVIKKYYNIFVTVGKTAIARRMRNAGTYANEGQITYGAVGTGTNTPSVSDTQLQAEINRQSVASSTNANNVVTIRVFYTTAQANGSLKEFGYFGEAATASADSGTLFNRAAIDITKTSAQTLTIEVTFTVG